MKIVGKNLTHNEQSLGTKKGYYCCLYHFLEGKQNKSSTHCYSHVPLGVINPITKPIRKIKPYKSNSMAVYSHKYQMEHHTHYLNEIELKGSLPKRLIYPRIYVEKIVNSQVRQPSSFAYWKHSKKQQFDRIFILFQKLSTRCCIKSELELRKYIDKFSQENNLINKINFLSTLKSNNSQQYLYSYQNFTKFILSCKFNHQQSEEFWLAIYHQNIFSMVRKNQGILPVTTDNFVSMRAFVFNFKKFYLDQKCYYKNCFSKHALQQRLIDLRLVLRPWFVNNFKLQINMLKWKQKENEIKKQLQILQQKQLINILIQNINERNKEWNILYSIASIFYQLTDQNQFGLDVINQHITYHIQYKQQCLKIFQKFMHEFFKRQQQSTSIQALQNLQNNEENNKKYKITDIIQFATIYTNDIQKRQYIVQSIRRLFQYLYFDEQQHKLILNEQNMNLQCTQMIIVQYSTLVRYLNKLKQQINNFIRVICLIGEEINQQVQIIPELHGHKKYLVQCNYITQTLLRIVGRCDFTVFFRLYQCLRQIEQGNQIKQTILQYLNVTQEGKKQIKIPIKFWKKYFEIQIFLKKYEIEEKDQRQCQRYKQILNKYPQYRAISINRQKIQNNSHYIRNDICKQNQQQQKSNKIKDKIQKQCLSSSFCSICNQFISNHNCINTIHSIQQKQNYILQMLKTANTIDI